jgi:hypothetical protein
MTEREFANMIDCEPIAHTDAGSKIGHKCSSFGGPKARRSYVVPWGIEVNQQIRGHEVRDLLSSKNQIIAAAGLVGCAARG